MTNSHETTRYEDIRKHLKLHGIDAYAPAQKHGECTAPYTVVKQAGSNKVMGISSVQDIYDLMCYVPKEHYTDLSKYVSTVKAIMAQLQPMIMPMYSETPSFYDDTVKAHMVSVQYRNNRKIESRR